MTVSPVLVVPFDDKPNPSESSSSSPPTMTGPGTLPATVTSLVLHPHHEIVPEMRDDEYQYLLEDIRINGVQTPIDLDADGVTVLDGKHRLRAARELGLHEVPFRIVQLRIDDARTFMLKAALLRRHLSDGQRAMVAAKLGKANSKRGGDRKSHRARRLQADGTGVGLKGRAKERPALAKAAETMGVSMTQAIKAAEVLHADPTLAKEVHVGKVTLPVAHREVRKKKRVTTGPKVRASGGSQASAGFTAFKAQKRLTDIGERARPHADQVAEGLSDVAALLEVHDITDLGESWSWLSGLFAQASRVTTLLWENATRLAAIVAAADAAARPTEQAPAERCTVGSSEASQPEAPAPTPSESSAAPLPEISVAHSGEPKPRSRNPELMALGCRCGGNKIILQVDGVPTCGRCQRAASAPSGAT